MRHMRKLVTGDIVLLCFVQPTYQECFGPPDTGLEKVPRYEITSLAPMDLSWGTNQDWKWCRAQNVADCLDIGALRSPDASAIAKGGRPGKTERTKLREICFSPFPDTPKLAWNHVIAKHMGLVIWERVQPVGLISLSPIWVILHN